MKNRRWLKWGIYGFVLLSVLVFCYGCMTSFGYVEEEVYTSPQGTNTIVVKYDAMSRPEVFKRGWLWDRKIWSYPKGAFMETVHFGVEWLSEDQIQLEYKDVNNEVNDEVYLIVIAD